LLTDNLPNINLSIPESSRMGPHEAPDLNYSEELWVNWFMDGIINSDIDDIGAKSVLHYLIDLKILEYDGDKLLKLSEVKRGQTSDDVVAVLLEKLNRAYHTEVGFALVYFISSLSKCVPPPLLLEGSSPELTRKNIFGSSFPTRQKKTSDLSNLQIVKKWGNELRPFLDLEQQTIARLRGKYTSQDDAQRLFSYILDKTRQKSPAKKWEQLSRKRHR